jgi:hypothetical protein
MAVADRMFRDRAEVLGKVSIGVTLPLPDVV